MRIASWNINGIRARLPLLTEWLKDKRPDVAALQEIKSIEENFPSEAIEDLGYNVALIGQKSFNGVALLARRPIENIVKQLPGDAEDSQARWIEAHICGEQGMAHICCLYLPNGNPAPGEKYDYKLAWMRRLEEYTQKLLQLEEPTLLVGDWNVIPSDIDAGDPEMWREDALALPQTRYCWRRILNQGWSDACQLAEMKERSFTFWDYQRNSWARDMGIRIDHIVLSPQAVDRMRHVEIEREMRGRDKPSDHVPICCEIEI